MSVAGEVSVLCEFNVLPKYLRYTIARLIPRQTDTQYKQTHQACYEESMKFYYSVSSSTQEVNKLPSRCLVQGDTKKR
jgi:hypothetical protein